MKSGSFARVVVAILSVAAVSHADFAPAPFPEISLYENAVLPAALEQLQQLADILDRRRLPITTDNGPVGKKLQEWAAEGTAAGLAGDWYDNRDRDHSRFRVEKYPQLRRVEYSAFDRATNRDWAAQLVTHDQVVFGNSSTSAPAPQGGSNPRYYYGLGEGLRFLEAQYRSNNLYVYPEHQDHDPGRFGDGGWGDLYPTNTPCLLISQGSSGTDQPFLDAIAVALAALRPEVKAELIGRGMLMPTVQMLLRRSLKTVQSEDDYLSAKAHPTVFEGSQLDSLRLAEMAHALTPDTLPPLVQLRLVESDSATRGRDFFEAAGSEDLGRTPSVIARVFRAAEYRRRCVVSAAASVDPREQPLTFRWVLLRGDPAHVRLTPHDAECEIVWDYHERAAIAPGAALESNRVDIGVFASNGRQWSAPAFVTSFTLDTEARTYDESGRLLEIGYGMGEAGVEVADWPIFIGALTESELPEWPLTPAQRTSLAALAENMRRAKAEADTAAKAREAAEKAKREAPPDQREAAEATLQAAIKASDTANRTRDELPNTTPDGFGEPIKSWLAKAFRERVHDTAHYLSAATYPAAGEADLKRLITLGIVREIAGGGIEPLPVRTTGASIVERLSDFQREQIARWDAALTAATPGLRATYRTNLVDFRLTAPRAWRDVYHYDSAGRRTGWTRYDTGGPFEFTADGALVESRDAQSRPKTARLVDYTRDRGMDGALRWTAGPAILDYEYTGPEDLLGHIARRESTPPPGP